MSRARANAASVALFFVASLGACAPKPSVLETVSEQLPARPSSSGGEAGAGSAADGGREGTPSDGGHRPGPRGAEGGVGGAPSAEPYEGRFVRFTGQELIFIGVVTFEGEATLTAAGRAAVDEIGELLRTRTAIARLEIQAHVDAKSEGDQARLTQRRAEAVRDHLVALGVDAGRLEARGYGSEMPIDSNRTPEGRAANRRVDFVLLETAK